MLPIVFATAALMVVSFSVGALFQWKRA